MNYISITLIFQTPTKGGQSCGRRNESMQWHQTRLVRTEFFTINLKTKPGSFKDVIKQYDLLMVLNPDPSTHTLCDKMRTTHSTSPAYQSRTTIFRKKHARDCLTRKLTAFFTECYFYLKEPPVEFSYLATFSKMNKVSLSRKITNSYGCQ